MQDWNFKRWDIKGSGKAKRALKLGQESTRSNRAEFPAPTPRRQSFTAPMDKQLGNKSALFALSKVRNTSTPGSNLCSLRQPTPSRQHPGVGQGEGRGTTPSALLARGVDPTPQRGPAPGGSPISGLTTCHPHPPCRCLLSSPQPETRGCFGEGGGGAEVNSSRDLVSEVHWADLFGQDPCGSGGSLWHKLWRNSFTAVTRKM